MADPDVDSGLVFDDEGKIDIANSDFYNVGFGSETTVGEYVDRILYSLSLAIKDKIPSGGWIVRGRPPSITPTPATFPKTAAFCSLLIVILSSIVWLSFLS